MVLKCDLRNLLLTQIRNFRRRTAPKRNCIFLTLISSRVVPSSSACDDSSLSLVCSSPPYVKEKHDLNFVLSEVSNVHSLHCKRTESGKLSKFRQSQLTTSQVKYKNTVTAKSFERRYNKQHSKIK